MRRDTHINITVDTDTARLLTQLAELEAEGNRSRYLRQLIRRTGKALSKGRPEPRNAAEENHAA